MIAYKVINKNTRRSVLIPYPDKYSIVYPNTPNIVITTLPNTIGIFCFKSKQFAKLFINDLFDIFNPVELTIIKVEGIGKPFTPKNIAPLSTAQLFNNNLDAFYKSTYCRHTLPPQDTICFKSIKII